MLTLDQIQTIKINRAIVTAGVEQAEKRLQDALETKKTLEQRALAVLGGYITVSLALFGLASNLGQSHPLFYALVCAGACLLGGMVALFVTLQSFDYGTLGRYPDTWLEPGTLDGDEGTLSRIMGSILFGYQNRIGVSDRSNARKASWLNIGMFMGLSAPFAFLIALVMIRFHFS